MTSDAIRSLNDISAAGILGAIARSRARTMADHVPWSAGLGQMLAHEFQLAPGTAAVSEGELARQALLVLAEDPETLQAIETMAAVSAGRENEAREKFDVGATVGITVAVLIVLQTHIRFERESDGKWSLKVEKKPTSDALLKGLVQKLISFAK